MRPPGWKIVEVECAKPTRHRVVVVEREGLIHAVAEVSSGLPDERDEHPPKLEMVYALPDSRGATGSAHCLVEYLKQTLSGLSHTGVLSAAGRKFVDRYGIPPQPLRFTRQGDRAACSRSDQELTDEKAEQLGRELLADAEEGRRMSDVQPPQASLFARHPPDVRSRWSPHRQPRRRTERHWRPVPHWRFWVARSALSERCAHLDRASSNSAPSKDSSTMVAREPTS